MAKELVVGQEVNRRCEQCGRRLIYLGKKEKSGVYEFQCPKCLVIKPFFEKVF